MTDAQRGGRHWKGNSDAAVQGFGLLLHAMKSRHKFPSDQAHENFVDEVKASISPDLMFDILVNLMIYETSNRLLVEQFKQRLKMPAPTAAERMAARRRRREWLESVVHSRAFFQLIKAGHLRRSDIRLKAYARWLSLTVIWLELAMALYNERFGDPHKLATACRCAVDSMSSQVEALRRDGFDELADKIESDTDRDLICFAGIFPPGYLAHSKGNNPSGAVRAWIIRTLNAILVPKELTPVDGRWAVISDLLELSGITATSTLVRSTATRNA